MSTIDIWSALRASTRARIGLGRSGDSIQTDEQLKFQLAHAQARDAVHGRVDFEKLANDLAPISTILVHTAASDRSTYLTRPDLGRRLDGLSHKTLTEMSSPGGVIFVIADGLSSAAVQTHAAPLLDACLMEMATVPSGPAVLVEQGRVAVGDEIGELLGAELVVVLIGERPGLSSPDSIGVYLTWNPRIGRKDSERNCISNIHANGLSYPDAAAKVAWLVENARLLKASGIALKEPDTLRGLDKIDL